MRTISAAAGYLAVGRPPFGGLNPAASDTLVIAGGQLSNDAATGAALGIEEAQRTAGLLGMHVKWQARSAGAAAIVTSGSIATHGCAFALMPPASVVANRLDAWRHKDPPSPGSDSARVEAWHASLAKFGASELNTRFERFAHRPMTSDAWLAWCAVKAITDAWLRKNSALCDSLAHLEFDGHKGEPLAFDASTGTLRQPLYVVSGRAVIGVLP